MRALDETSTAICHYTDGNWLNEDDAKAHLDALLATRPDLFKSYKEVSGEYVQPKYGCEQKTPRIDRLLIPRPALLSAGWRSGAIGVECKCSEKKLGQILAQCKDYGRAVFKLPETGISIVCEWIFIWPLSGVVGDVASLMTQDRIGELSTGNSDVLNFGSANGGMIRVKHDGSVVVKNYGAGKKTGSR